jgi:acyl-CoA reductase-like NAD-dependent aldehyde dehydrogenase
MEEYPFLLGGVPRTGSELQEIRFPYSGECIAKVWLANGDDLDAAAECAFEGFSITKELSSYMRSRILFRMADELERRKAEFSRILTLEAGKTVAGAQVEVDRAAETLRISAEEAKRIYGEILPLDWTPDSTGRIGVTMRVPVGPVLGIIPFNFPLNSACHKLGPAIAAGNPVILKPASATPVSSIMLGEIAVESGLPPEAISVLPCPGERAERLVKDDRIAFVSFTGSSEVGWHLKSVSGRKRVALELGGTGAVIVHHDADLSHAVKRIVTGGFSNAGQVCISVQRVFLHASIYGGVVRMISDAVRALKTGDPRDPAVDVGPMISEAAADKAYGKVREAVGQGAEILAGGPPRGNLFFPTVIASTRPDMRVNREEAFAPFITVTPYEEFSDALRMANDTEYGLQMGVFTRDMNAVLMAFRNAEVGGLQVNDIPTFRVDQMPYGGVKASGTGREGPRYAIEEMTEQKLMVINTAVMK